MAVYPSTKLTDQGVALQRRAITERKAVIFTAIHIGNGDISGHNIANLTGLISEKMILPLIDVKPSTATGQYTITGALSNRDVQEDFKAKEVGIYAKLDGDSTPVLYAYSNAGDTGFYVPSKLTPIESQIYRVDVRISKDANVTIVLDDSVFLTRKELDSHNNDPQAHPPINAKIDNHIKDRNAHGIDDRMNNHRLQAELDHPNRSVCTRHIKDGAITTDKIADGQITRSKLSSNISAGTYVCTSFDKSGLATYGTNSVYTRVYFDDITASTPSQSDSSRRVATTEFVKNALGDMKDQVQDLINNTASIEIRDY